MIADRFKKFDWILFGGIFLLALASLVSLYSIDEGLFSRQLLWFGGAFLVILAGAFIPWSYLGTKPWFRHSLYWISIAFLFLTLFQAEVIRGTRRWLVFGGVHFEPSELAKVALIIFLAGYFSRLYIAAWQGKNILTSFIYFLLPATLIFLQPDFSSVLVLMGIWFLFLLAGGINKKRMAAGIILAALVFTGAWSFMLQDYQKDRVTTFMFPERDPLGSGYNVIQSKIAIGSAGFWGKGFEGGTQAKLKFLPEAYSDFLFAAFVEERGIFGGLLLVLTFLLIAYRLTRIGLLAKNNFSKFVVLGSGCLIAFHFFINVGSNLGLIPPTGITFPFFSYGGSSILTISVLISIIEHIKIESAV